MTCIFFKVCFLIFFFLSLDIQAEIEIPVLTLGYLENGLKDLNDVDKQVALNLLAKELTRDSNVVLSVLPLHDIQELLTLAKDGKIDYAILNSYYYLSDVKHLKPYVSADLWAIQRSQNPAENYVLVVNNKFEYKDIKSLAGKRFSLNQDHLMINFYLKYLLKKYTSISVDKYFEVIKNTRTASQSVLDVFFNTSDVCLVPDYALDLVNELNPAVKQGVKVVHQSGSHFIPAVVLAFNNSNNIYSDKVKNNLDNISGSVRGQEILELFNIKNITKVDGAHFDYMSEIFEEYKNMGSGIKYVNKAP